MPRVLVLNREGDPGKCCRCDARPKYVVHDQYAPYVPTEEERESKKRPFEKTCNEKFQCLAHFNQDYAMDESHYFELAGQADFTFTTIEAWVSRSKQKKIFFYERGK